MFTIKEKRTLPHRTDVSNSCKNSLDGGGLRLFVRTHALLPPKNSSYGLATSQAGCSYLMAADLFCQLAIDSDKIRCIFFHVRKTASEIINFWKTFGPKAVSLLLESIPKFHTRTSHRTMEARATFHAQLRAIQNEGVVISSTAGKWQRTHCAPSLILNAN